MSVIRRGACIRGVMRKPNIACRPFIRDLPGTVLIWCDGKL